MYYIFIATPAARTLVNFIKAKNTQELRKSLQSFQSTALFIFNETTDEIDIVSDYYDALECSYFIYTLLGIFKPIKDSKVSYPH